VVPYVPYLACSDLFRYDAIRTVHRLPCVVYTRWDMLFAGYMYGTVSTIRKYGGVVPVRAKNIRYRKYRI